MKKGINAWSFATADVKECINLASEIGYDGIELALTESSDINLSTSVEDLKAIKKYAAMHNIQIHSLSCGLCWDYSFADNSVEEREKAIEIAEIQIKAAALLGATSVLLVPGSVWSILRPNSDKIPYDIAYQRNFDAFSRLKPFAENYDVNIGIENVWNKIFLSPLELRDFIDKLHSTHIGAYFDVGNVLSTGYPEDWIRILNKRIKKVHLKDFRQNTTGFDGFVDLLAGEVDWIEVIKALKEIGYNGYLTAETAPYKYYPEQILSNTYNSMCKILG